MSTVWRKLSCFVLLGVSLALSASARTKFIADGFDVRSASPEQIVAHAALFDELGCDGVGFVFRIVKGAGGRQCDYSWGAMSDDWKYEDLSSHLPAMREMAKRPSLAESMLGICWTPIMCKRLAWTDDAAWAKFAANMKVIARLLRESGLKILDVDTEDYSRQRQYTLQGGDPSYEVTAKLARRRGREIGRALFDEMPDMKLFSCWLLSMERTYARADNPAGAVRAMGDLWVPFVDGLLDVLPPTATLIDGDEHGYGYQTERHEFDLAIARHLAETHLLAPENRAKFRAQTSFGTGHYLDGFLLKEGEEYHNETGTGDTKLGTLAKRLRDAARTGDGYIWFWGEHRRYVKWRDLRPAFENMKIGNETWEETYPGFTAAIREIKDPEAALVRRLDAVRADGKTANLAAPALVRFDDTWQSKKSNVGTFAVEAGAGHGGSARVTAAGVGWGTVQLSLGAAKPGVRFIAETYVNDGDHAHVALRWRAKGDWFRSMSLDAIGTVGPADAEGWHRLIVQGRVPEGAYSACLQLNVALAPDQKLAFDRIFAAKIDEIR